MHHILLNVVNYNFFLFKMSDSYSDSMDEDENAVRHDIHLFFTLIVTHVWIIFNHLLSRYLSNFKFWKFMLYYNKHL